jgi:hypothetical protein
MTVAHLLRASALHSQGADGRNVRVAVVDVGINTAHLHSVAARASAPSAAVIIVFFIGVLLSVGERAARD